MKKITGFIAPFLLLFNFLALSSTVQATDTDGDGVLNVFPVQISAGARHVCALDSTGVHCWGYNNYFQSRVPKLTKPVAVSAGGLHTCAIDAEGVQCWGANGYGQSKVPTLKDPVAISAGGNHTCAITSEGLKCWGDNTYKQSTVPTLSNPVAVSAGQRHTCAIDDTGVHCWGDDTFAKTTVPTTLVNPVAVSAGISHTCALDANGVKCWGYNQFKQLKVPTLSNPVAIGANGNHTCAIDANGMKCWGESVYGQIKLPSLTHPTSLALGYQYSCAVDVNKVKCWGNNYYGQTTRQPVSFKGDNCPSNSNEDQADADGDGKGDVCDDTPDPVSLTLTSVASRDGWILETKETSQKGGRSDAANASLIIGDSATNQEYVSIVHFDTAQLPNNAVIIKATLTLNRQSVKGSIKGLGNLVLDIPKKFFGSGVGFAANDFQAEAEFYSAASFSATNSVYKAALDSSSRTLINKTAPTQFRLRFGKDDNNNKRDDYLKFYSGNATTPELKPTLQIQYYLPD